MDIAQFLQAAQKAASGTLGGASASSSAVPAPAAPPPSAATAVGALASLLGGPAGANPALAALGGSPGARPTLAALGGPAGANPAFPAGINPALAALGGAPGINPTLAPPGGTAGGNPMLDLLTAGRHASVSTGADSNAAALSKVAAADPATALLLASAQQKLKQQQSTLESLQRLQNLQSLQLQQVLAEQQQKQQQLQLLASTSTPPGVGDVLGAAVSAAVNAAATASSTRPVVSAAQAAASPVWPGPVVPPALPAASASAAVLGQAAQPPPSSLATPAPVPAGQPSGVQPGSTLVAKRSSDEVAVRERVANVKAAREAKIKADAEAKKKMQAEEVTKCHLHKKPKGGCKFCRRHEEYLESLAQKASSADSSTGKKGGLDSHGDEGDQRKPIEISNAKTYGFSTLVQTHILDSHYYQSILGLQSFEQLIEEANQYAKSVEPYMPDSTVMPTPFICLVHRLFTLSLDGNQMFHLLDHTESPYIRCLGFVYLRFGLHIDRLWGWLGEYVLDDEEFQPTQGVGQEKTTIGEFVEELLSKEKYYGALLPRVTGAVKRQLEEKLAPVAQCRKRTWANRENLDFYRQKGTRVEACIEGTWHDGTVVELIEDFPSRLKVLVRLNGSDGGEETVHLGKVILRDGPTWGMEPKKKASKRERSRSRSQDRVDWSRHKGKSDEDLVEELRRGARERAVCTSGKDYSRRPTTFDKGLAQPREGQGVAARRLLEEETIVKVSSKKRRSPSPSSSRVAKPKEVSEEHKQRMQKLFEKYGNVKPTEAQKASDDIGGPDVLRLG